MTTLFTLTERQERLEPTLGLRLLDGVTDSNISSVMSATGGHGGCPYIFTPALCFAQLEGVGGSKATLDAAVAAGQSRV